MTCDYRLVPLGPPASFLPPALSPRPITNLQAPLWRSIAAFRFASVAYAAILLLVRPDVFSHWGWAWVIVVLMTIWTVATTVLYRSPLYSTPNRRTRLLLAVDLLLTIAAVLSTVLVQYPRPVQQGVMPVTATWIAGPALAWAAVGGVRAARSPRFSSAPASSG